MGPAKSGYSLPPEKVEPGYVQLEMSELESDAGDAGSLLSEGEGAVRGDEGRKRMVWRDGIGSSSGRICERVVLVLVGFALALGTFALSRHGQNGAEWVKKLVGLDRDDVPPRINPLQSPLPLDSFRANLKPGYAYVTSFQYGGLTNQLMELFKLVHVAQRLNRVAVLPDLRAAHHEDGFASYSSFFNLDAFSHYTNVSLAEWSDLKTADSLNTTEPEVLACWGWQDRHALDRYNVRPWFWPYPGQLVVSSAVDKSITFPGIEVLASQDNSAWLNETAARIFGSVEKSPAPFPDQQLLCFEHLFYVPSVKFVEGQLDTSYTIEELRPDGPVWSKVGRHLHFNERVYDVADELVASLLGSPRTPFIAVHLRQGDFLDLGRTVSAVDQLAPKYSAGVSFVRNELEARGYGRGARDLPVLLATDSDDEKFIAQLEGLGWIYVNHTRFGTAETYGGWWVGVLDSVVLSRATGFVGTRQSTFSYVAARRVETWNGGVTTVVG
ncbi:hypothetical protein JCM1840_001441 [Sporobolomyces johnsonii]